MNEGNAHTYLLLGIGAALVLAATAQQPGGTQLVLATSGFAAFLAGVLKMYVDGRHAPGGAGETPSSWYLRPAGASIVFLSTLLPYLPLPIDRGATRTAYSFVDVALAMVSGAGVEGGLSIIIFASVVFAGAAASLLHYSGGYVVLFGVAGYGYVVSLLMEMGMLTVFLNEFRVGMYAAVLGAVLVILSSLVTPPGDEGEVRDRSFLHETAYSRRRSDR